MAMRGIGSIAPMGGIAPLRNFFAFLVAVLITCAALVPDARAATIQYVYDEIGRLTAVIDPDGDTTEYAYDDVGNILSVTRRATVTLAIVSFSPASGPVGTAVTLVGAGFDAAPANNTVKFNGTTASVSSATATQLVAVVPSGATTGLITISNSRGSAASATPFTVTVPQPPTIASFAPSVAVPGASVTITGSNFGTTPATNQVKVNQAAATVQSAAADSLVVTVPSASGGKISVATAAGTAVSANDLFIAPPPLTAIDIGATGRVQVDGAPAALSIAATRVGLVLVDGTAADSQLRVVVANAAFQFGATATLSIYKPDGTLLTNAGGFTGNSSLAIPALPASGTYSILVTPTSQRSGDASISVVRDVFGALQLDTPLVFTAGVAGKQGHFTFQGTAGTRPTLLFSAVTFPNGGTYALRFGTGTIISATAFGTAGVGVKLPTLSSTGTYTVDIIPANLATGSVTVELKNVADVDAGALVVDVPSQVTFTSGGQIARATFTGAVGDVFGISLQDVAISGGSLRLLRPDGGVVTGPVTFTSAGFVTRLPALAIAGTYTIEITSSGVAGGALSLTLWRDVIGGTAVVDGPAITLNFAFPGQIAHFTFQGAAGTSAGLQLGPGTLASGGSFIIRRPGGSTLAFNIGFASAGVSYRMGVLSETGTYTVDVTPNSNGTGTLAAKVWTDIDAGALVYGGAKDIAIGNPAQLAKFTFTAAAGENVGLTWSNVAFPSGVTFFILSPSNSLFVGNTGIGAAGLSYRLPAITQAGTYTVTVTPGANGTGSIRAALWKDVDAGAMAYGDVRDITISNPAQLARFTFTAASGDNVGLNWSNVTFPSGVTFFILSPTNSLFVGNTGIGPSGLAYRLPPITQTGVYTVTITPGANGTGSIRAALWKDVDIGPVNFGETKDIAITNPAQIAKFTFTAAVGDSIGLEWKNMTFPSGATFFILSPTNSLFVANTGIGPSGLVYRLPAITQAGTYTVTFTPGANATGTAKVLLWKDVDGGTLAYGDTRDFTIPNPGQVLRFRFAATPGDLAGFDWSNITFVSGGGFNVLSPTNSFFVGNTGLSTSGLIYRMPAFSQAGVYTVTFTPAANGTGTIRVQLWKDVTTSVVVDDTAAKVIDVVSRGQQAHIAFQGTTGVSTGFQIGGITLPSGGSAGVRRPDGSTQVGSNGFSTGPLIVRMGALPQTGTYTMDIIPAANGTGSVAVKVWTDVDAGSLAYGESRDIVIPNAAQIAKFTFTAAAGDNPGIDLSNAASFVAGGQYLVTAPNGSTFVGNTGFSSAGTFQRMPVVTLAGTYTVTITPASVGTGSLRASIWKDVAGTLTLGTPFDLAIAFRAQQGRLGFAATTGQSLKIGLSSIAFVSGGSIQVFTPSGAPLAGATGFSTSPTTVNLPVLPADGTYTVVVIPAASQTGGITLNLANQ